MKEILIVDLRGVIANGGLDVWKRHAEYLSALSTSNPKCTLKILSLSKNQISQEFKSLIEVQTHLAKFLFQLAQRLRNPQTSMIVCGDPWESVWVVRLISFMARKEIPVQVQIHGDIGNETWRKLNFRNAMRFHLTSFGLKYAEQIRTVSEIQLKHILKKWPSVGEKCFVAPVPYDTDLTFPKMHKFDSGRKVVAFIGRLHADRGIDLFLRIAKLALEKIENVSIEIIGDGPKRKYIEDCLFLSRIAGKVNIRGHLTKQELEEVWPTIDVLISTPPAESFGRTVRESLLYGVPVLATETSGIQSLISNVGNSYISLIYDSDYDEDLVLKLNRAFDTNVPRSVVQYLVNEQKTGLDKVISAWQSLIKSS